MTRVFAGARRPSLATTTCVLAAAVAAQLVAQVRPAGVSAGVLGGRSSEQLRVMTWNVGDDSNFPPPGMSLESLQDARPARFTRVMRAVRPDILCMQEATRAPKDIATLMSAVLPPPAGERWNVHVVFDNAIVTRFPLTMQGGRVFTEGQLRRGHATALIDLPNARFSRDLYMLCAHFQSRAGDAQVALRQRQADAIAAWLRDARSPGGEITLAHETPIVVLGDLNVIDMPSPSLNTLLTGDIADEAQFGSDAKPDWDGTDLSDSDARHNETGSETYTWRDDTQPYPPGVLDRILFTDSVMRLARAFVLDTTQMNDEELRRASLRPRDVMRDPARGVHDHLPIIADLVVSHPATSAVRRAR